MRAFGRFVFDGRHAVPNVVTDGGIEAILKAAFRQEDIGASLYVGLCGDLPHSKASTLADLSDELAVANGYARQEIPSSAVGWPVVEKTASGFWRIVSQTLTFTATGGDFSAPFNRAFLCNVASGSAGILLAMSGERPISIQVTDGNSRTIHYELFLN